MSTGIERNERASEHHLRDEYREGREVLGWIDAELAKRLRTKIVEQLARRDLDEVALKDEYA